tara:strand:+ start:29 stop:1276 length:1248 start_codon:yes stop_codon:yes gene_type:complete
MRFYTKADNGSNTERLRISNAGNIGIGTVSPDTLLHLKSSGAGDPKIKIENTNADQHQGMIHFYKTGSSPADGDAVGSVAFYADNSADEETLFGDMKAYTDDVTDGTEDGSIKFRTIKDGTLTDTMSLVSGSVGIGTSSVGGSPGAGSVQFHKDANNYVRIWDNATATMYLQSNGANAPSVSLKNSNSDALEVAAFQQSNAGGNILGQSRNGLQMLVGAPNGVMAIGTSNAKNLVLGTNNTTAATIDSSQNVGIAMSPGGSHRLDVTGSAGLSTGTAWTNTSDARIKKDVATITGATAKLKQLRPVSYKYTDQYLNVHDEIDGAKTYHSFIADEYETVFPDAVSVQGDLIKTTPATYYADGDDLPSGKSVGDEKTAETSETLLTNLKQYTPHDLQMFVVAAVQELDARIAALEAA